MFVSLNSGNGFRMKKMDEFGVGVVKFRGIQNMAMTDARGRKEDDKMNIHVFLFPLLTYQFLFLIILLYMCHRLSPYWPI